MRSHPPPVKRDDAKSASSLSVNLRSQGSQKADSQERARMRLLASNAASRRALGISEHLSVTSVLGSTSTSTITQAKRGTQTQLTRSNYSPPPLPRPGQTFGVDEAPPYKTTEEFIQASITDPFYAPKWERMSPAERSDTIELLYEMAPRALAPGLGAHPMADDPTVRYSIIDWPAREGAGSEKLIIRWWSGRKVGYYLDIVDTRRGSVRATPKGFYVAFYQNGGETFVESVESVMKKISPGLDEEFKTNAYGDFEERWVVPSGSKVYIYCNHKKIARVRAPVSPEDGAVDENGVPEYEAKRVEFLDSADLVGSTRCP